MSSTNELTELFQDELMDVYDAEQRIESALGEMAGHVEHEEARRAFEEHREQTREQIDRIEQVFEMLDVSPETKECKAIQGIVDEHEEFAGENPSQNEHDLFDVVAAQKVEHYEIAAYGNLAKMASEMGMDEAGDLLHRNLEEEQQTLERLTRLADQWDYEALAA